MAATSLRQHEMAQAFIAAPETVSFMRGVRT
jgi:hypothetical protein